LLSRTASTWWPKSAATHRWRKVLECISVLPGASIDYEILRSGLSVSAGTLPEDLVIVVLIGILGAEQARAELQRIAHCPQLNTRTAEDVELYVQARVSRHPWFGRCEVLERHMQASSGVNDEARRAAGDKVE
jgi:hypothetical protein